MLTSFAIQSHNIVHCGDEGCSVETATRTVHKSFPQSLISVEAVDMEAPTDSLVDGNDIAPSRAPCILTSKVLRVEKR